MSERVNTTQQPLALRLADKYEVHGFLGDHSFAKEQWCSQVAVELRRQHARIVELEEMLRREVQHSAGLRVAPIATSPEAKSDAYQCQAPQGYVRPQEPDSHDGHDYEGFIGGCQRMRCEAQGTDSRDAAPIAWYVTGCSTMLDEHDAKAEAKRCGGSAKAVPLYTRPAEVAA